MKQIAIAAILALATSFASAETVTVEYDHLTGKNVPNVGAVSVVPSINAYGLTLDSKLTAAHSVKGGNFSTAEVRARKDFAVAKDTTAFVRGGLGKAYAAGESMTFYTIEPGANYALSKGLNLNASYKFSNSFNRADDAKVNTTYVGLDYALTKKDSLGLKLYKDYGDVKGKGFVVGYTRSF